MKTLNADLKSGNLKRVYLLYGDDAFLKRSFQLRFLAAAASLRRTGKRLVVSAGDGETEDPVIADLAVALNAEGLVTKSSAVYNELMRIEEELFDVPEYPEN